MVGTVLRIKLALVPELALTGTLAIWTPTREVILLPGDYLLNSSFIRPTERREKTKKGRGRRYVYRSQVGQELTCTMSMNPLQPPDEEQLSPSDRQGD